MRFIRANRLNFSAEAKGENFGTTDWVTNIDREAQKLYEKLLLEAFPDHGIIGEEDGLNKPCTLPNANWWRTVDPIDGTGQFVRQASDGIGSMLALMRDGAISESCIGDVMTGELYYSNQDLPAPLRIDGDIRIELRINPDRPLSKQFALLYDPVKDHFRTTRRLLTRKNGHRFFKSHEICGSSLGLAAARLFKGEVGALICRPYGYTPWDFCPVFGICEKMGIIGFKVEPKKMCITRMHVFPVKTQKEPMPYELILMHESRVSELKIWCAIEGIQLDL